MSDLFSSKAGSADRPRGLHACLRVPRPITRNNPRGARNSSYRYIKEKYRSIRCTKNCNRDRVDRKFLRKYLTLSLFSFNRLISPSTRHAPILHVIPSQEFRRIFRELYFRDCAAVNCTNRESTVFINIIL